MGNCQVNTISIHPVAGGVHRLGDGDGVTLQHHLVGLVTERDVTDLVDGNALLH